MQLDEEDRCAECNHDVDCHGYLLTPNLQCNVEGCDCQEYVVGEDVLTDEGENRI